MIENLFKFFSFFLVVSLYTTPVSAEGYEIKVRIEGFDQKELYLGNYLMDKQYLRDTAAVEEGGWFTFTDEETLPAGVYIVVMPPENKYFQILVNDNEQHFTIETKADDLVSSLKTSGSTDNLLFNEYLKFLNEHRPEADELREKIKEADTDEKQVEKLQQKLDVLNRKVEGYRKEIVENHDRSLTAAIIKSTMEIEFPEFSGSEKEVQNQKFRYYRNHYFSYIDLADPRLLRSPFLFQRVDQYVNKLTVQHPDSISEAIDFLLTRMEPSEETFKFYLIHFLNTYAKSKIVGMDAVYVHIVDKYYAAGQATWTPEEQLNKIVKNANTLKPILIGKIAPDLDMKILDLEGTIEAKDNENELLRVKVKESLPLHQVNSPYTILIFWAPDCGHCQKVMPKLKEFYQNFKDKGVEIYSVCGKTVKENGMVDCAKMIKEKGLTDWLNVVDPYYRSKYKTIYDVRTTPQIFVLDEKKEILSKRISVEQLEEVMNDIIEFRQREKSEQQ